MGRLAMHGHMQSVRLLTRIGPGWAEFSSPPAEWHMATANVVVASHWGSVQCAVFASRQVFCKLYQERRLEKPCRVEATLAIEVCHPQLVIIHS